MLPLLVATVALAKPALLVLPVAEAPDVEEVRQHVARAVSRPALQTVPVDRLDAEGLAGAAQARPTECYVDLEDAHRAALDSLRGELGDELYVALPSSDRLRDTTVWRFDTAVKELVLVVGTGPHALPPTEADGGRVIFLPWPTTDQAEKGLSEKQLRPLGPVEVQIDAPGLGKEALDLLVAHPNECVASVDDRTRAALTEAAAGEDGDLYVALHIPTWKGPIFWRWDGAQLRKVLI